MSNEKLAEALRAFPEDPNPFTYRRCYAKAQEALQAHAAEAEQAQAQAAQPVGVPVGWAKEYGRETLVSWSKEAPEHGKGWWPLYTQPPAQPSADAEDAARYRWMRVHVFDDDNWGQGECNTPDEVDACIDAARAAEGDGNGE